MIIMTGRDIMKIFLMLKHAPGAKRTEGYMFYLSSKITTSSFSLHVL